MSKIEWTDKTWNPVTGCTKISLGCKNCYAERIALDMQQRGHPRYANGFDVTIHKDRFLDPRKWSKRHPKMVFVNSMGDTFHESVSDDIILSLVRVMRAAPTHTFQVLTKRSFRMAGMFPNHDYNSNTPIEDLPQDALPDNVWAGVSVEDEETLYRVDDLRRVGAKIRFLSIEPLIEPLPHLDLNGIQWVIVGGESGARARPMHEEWIMPIKEQCDELEIPFFFKQWGNKSLGRLLRGREWDDMPELAHLSKANQRSFL